MNDELNDEGYHHQEGCIRIVAVSLVNEALVNQSF
jgi:hypothetical protein